MSAPTLRPAERHEAEALAALKLATFRATFIEPTGFAIPYPPADLAQFEEASYAPAVVARELADPRRAQWVVERDGTLLGYAHVGPCKLPHAEVQAGSGELYQLYLRAEAHGLGLGGRLMDVAFAHLAEAYPGPVWLGVWSGNQRAQAVYARRGFRKVGDYKFPVGAWTDDEFIFRRD